VAEPSEHHARFWTPATQIAISAQNAQAVQHAQTSSQKPQIVQPSHQNIVQNATTGGFRRRRLIRKTGHPSSAETLSENISPADNNNNNNNNINNLVSSSWDDVKDAVTGMDKRLGLHIDQVFIKSEKQV